MKLRIKIKLFLLILLLPLVLPAQDAGETIKSDEEMDLFLLVLGSLFVAAMLVAAALCALLAAFIFLLFVALFGFGILSVSAVIGIHKRSVVAGLKTALLLFFGSTGAFFGWIIFLFFSKFVSLNLTSAQASLAGGIAGLTGGVLLALMTVQVLRNILLRLVRRFSTA